MKFLEEKVSQVLDDLQVLYLTVVPSAGGVAVELDVALPVMDFVLKVRQDPRYNFRLSVHPFGYFLEFLNTSVPSLRALVDVYLDVRTINGRVVQVRGTYKTGRIFTADGEIKICRSLEELARESSEARRHETAVGEVDALG